MAVPFGFSVGDFIAVIGLLKDVGVALQDTGGAAEEYQDAVRQMETLVAVFQEVQSIESASHNQALLNAIRGQAQTSQNKIVLFLERIQKYEPKLGSKSKPGFHHGTLSKAKWATYVSKEVRDLHETLQSQNLVMMLLLNMLNIKLGSAIEASVKETKSRIMDVNQIEEQFLETRAVVGSTKVSLEKLVESRDRIITSKYEEESDRSECSLRNIRQMLDAWRAELQSSITEANSNEKPYQGQREPPAQFLSA